MTSIRIGDRAIGADHPCFVIAEAGVNHNGDRVLARRLVEAAAEAGADAVKFQSFTASELLSDGAPKAAYQTRGAAPNESQFDMLKRLQLSEEDHRDLMVLARRLGLIFLSSPFDAAAAQMLDGLGVEAFKVASGELTNLPFLARLAARGRPLILSTGMSDLTEVAAAVEAIAQAGDPPLVLLHCTSAYPAAPDSVNLRAMDSLSQTFNLPVGYSDHSLGIDIAIAAVARGACLIEKHLTLDRRLSGPDHQASAEPQELARMIGAIRRIEMALGDGVKRPTEQEVETREVARRSITAARDIEAGAALCAADLTLKRPGVGLSPSQMPEILGCRTRCRIAKGSLISWEQLS